MIAKAQGHFDDESLALSLMNVAPTPAQAEAQRLLVKAAAADLTAELDKYEALGVDTAQADPIARLTKGAGSVRPDPRRAADARGHPA